MRVLILGADGFIGREILNYLRQLPSYQLIASSRRTSVLLEQMPDIQYQVIDLKKMTTTSHWQAILSQVDVVINCIGIFHRLRSADVWQLHYDLPKILFDACAEYQVKKIIHISALGIEAAVGPYAKSKLAAEQYLQQLSIAHIIIRPSFVYGKNCYGGSALLRGLAAMPLATPIIAKGQQLLQPIHSDDLAHMVDDAIHCSSNELWYGVGPDKISLSHLIPALRAWLGFKAVPCFSVPLWTIRLISYVANLSANSPMSRTALEMMTVPNVVSDAQQQATYRQLSATPHGFTQGLWQTTSGISDRWHARLYCLRPVLRWFLAFIWLFSGIISLVKPEQYAYPLLSQIGIHGLMQSFILYAASLVDMMLGMLTLVRWRWRLLLPLQIAMILVYTLIISIYLPQFWLHPFAPLAKNIPIIGIIFVLMILERER